jgi:hypothetical protein
MQFLIINGIYINTEHIVSLVRVDNAYTAIVLSSGPHLHTEVPIETLINWLGSATDVFSL